MDFLRVKQIWFFISSVQPIFPKVTFLYYSARFIKELTSRMCGHLEESLFNRISWQHFPTPNWNGSLTPAQAHLVWLKSLHYLAVVSSYVALRAHWSSNSTGNANHANHPHDGDVQWRDWAAVRTARGLTTWKKPFKDQMSKSWDKLEYVWASKLGE